MVAPIKRMQLLIAYKNKVGFSVGFLKIFYWKLKNTVKDFNRISISQMTYTHRVTIRSRDDIQILQQFYNAINHFMTFRDFCNYRNIILGPSAPKMIRNQLNTEDFWIHKDSKIDIPQWDEYGI